MPVSSNGTPRQALLVALFYVTVRSCFWGLSGVGGEGGVESFAAARERRGCASLRVGERDKSSFF